MYDHPPAVCIFATFSMYKKESMRSSRYAPKILTDAGLSVVMKSDHNGVVARWMAQEAAIAHHWGLEEATAM
jgi:imidazolonepropionase-like amidohydrolase